MDHREYRILIHHEDGSYWAEVEQLPGCFVAGESIEEIWEALPEAIGLYLSEDGGQVEVQIQTRSQPAEVVDARMLVCS